MAKQKKQDETSFDDILDAAIEDRKKAFPDKIYTGSEEAMRCICLPVPSLAIRYLLQQEGLPQGRFILLDGPKESCKSAFSYEVIRWTRMARGRGIVIEVEDKRSPELCQSMLNYDPKAVTVERCETMEDWNSALTTWITDIRVLMDGDPSAPKARPGKGRLAPFVFVVDSIMSAVGEGTMSDILDEGHTKKHFAVDAGLLSEYMKTFTKWIGNYPFTVIGINHIKPTQAPGQNMPTRHMPGGKAPEYHASIDIELKRQGSQWKTVKMEGVTIKMKVQKNSSAPHAEITVDMCWYIDAEPTPSGEYLQRTWFDWASATWRMLKAFYEGCGTDKRARMRDLLDFKLNEKNGTIACEQLGISENDPVSFDDAHARLEEKIQNDPTFAAALYGLLGIRRRPMYVTGVDYREQMEDARVSCVKLQQDREFYIQSHPLSLSTGVGLGTSVFDDEVLTKAAKPEFSED